MKTQRSLFCLACVAGIAATTALAAPPAGKRYAVLVGVKAYKHSDLPDLEFTERDVTDLADILRPAGYQVTLLTTSAGEKDEARRPTLANIRKALAGALKDVGKADTVLVAVTGHGLQPTGSKESYFCPADANPYHKETLLSLTGLINQMTESGAGVKLLLVDACRNDPDSGRGRGIDGSRVVALPRGVAALFSCSAGQISYETRKAGGGHGIFFHYVLEALRERKLRNERGELTWSRLAEHVQMQVETKVPEWISPDARQVPHDIRNLEGRPPVVVEGWNGARLEPLRGLAPFDAAKARVAPEAFVSKPHDQWPQIVLTNRGQFRGHSAPYWEGEKGNGLASGFLIETPDRRILAATAKHLFVEQYGGIIPTLEISDLARTMVYWKMFPRGREDEAIDLNKLAVTADTLGPTDDDSVDWVFMTLKTPRDRLPAVTPLKVRDQPARRDEKVFLIAFAKPGGQQQVYPGVVESRLNNHSFQFRCDEDAINVAEAQRGFSGAPILDANGHVVGAVSSSPGVGKDIAQVADAVNKGKSWPKNPKQPSTEDGKRPK